MWFTIKYLSSTCEAFRVIGDDNRTYERSVIQHWLSTNHGPSLIHFRI